MQAPVSEFHGVLQLSGGGYRIRDPMARPDRQTLAPNPCRQPFRQRTMSHAKLRHSADAPRAGMTWKDRQPRPVCFHQFCATGLLSPA